MMNAKFFIEYLGEIIEKYNLKRKVKKIAHEYDYDASILPFRTVGVMGDERSYQYVAEIIGPYKEDTISELSTRLTNEVRGVNRVVIRIKP